MKKNFINLAIIIVISIALLFSMYKMYYVDLESIFSIYMPILGVAFIAVLINKKYAGNIYIISIIFGFLVEYAISFGMGGRTMLGAFLNMIILIVGIIIGTIVELIIRKRRIDKLKKNNS